jgi:diguanylate cyclase (GGDEF)-like protein
MVAAGALGLAADAVRLAGTSRQWLLVLTTGLAVALALALVALPWERWSRTALFGPLLGGIVVATLPFVAEPRPGGWLPLLPGLVWAGLVLPRGGCLAAAPAVALAVAAPDLTHGASVSLLEVVAATVILVGAGEGLALAADRAARARERAERAEARSGVLLTHAPGVVLVVDDDDVVTEASSGVAQLLCGPGLPLLEAVHPEDEATAVGALAQARAGPRPAVAEVRLRRRDSSWMRLAVTLTGLPDFPGEAGVIVSGVDVTAERDARDAALLRATTDPLTGLANRSALREAITSALPAGAAGPTGAGGLVFVDLDGFKLVNDSLGHDAGDRMLRHVADRLRRLQAPGRTLARLSGDEFALLDRDVPVAGLGSLGESVRQALQGAECVEGHDVQIRPSVGVTALVGALDADDLLRRADLAMYRAKGAGGDRVEVYEASSGRSDLRPVAAAELAAELVDGLRSGELEVHLQPVVRLGDGEVVGAEALVRWRHPSRGLLLPKEFVPLAERAGLAPSLDSAVLDLALAEAVRWRALGLPPLIVNVNVSDVQLDLPDWPDRVLAALEGRDVAPAQVCLGITPGAGRCGPRSAAALRRLAEAGVAIALDDVGGGPSSLLRLRHLPVHRLKLSSAFVAALDPSPPDALLEGLLALAARLGVDVLAVGVETPEQCVVLRAAGCSAAQGRLWSAPLPPDAFAARLQPLPLRR